jgi:L-iditol 2-dehydrogenase
MQSAILKAPGILELIENAIPVCPDNGLLVKVRACSICSSDVRMFYQGHPALRFPRVLGHEISGEVAESRSPGFKAGDRVQIYPGIYCNHCPACLRGDYTHCQELAIMGYSYDGALTEYLAVPSRSLENGGVNLVPPDLSYAEAALTEPLASCLNGQESARVSCDDTVLIIGAGPIGMLHVRLARQKHAAGLIMVEIDPFRVARCTGENLDAVVNPAVDNLALAVKKITGGRGADVILTASAQADIFTLIPLLAPRGRLCIFSGLPAESAQITFDANQMHYHELTITGAYGSSARQNTQALGLISSGAVPVKDLITLKLPLNRINEALEHASSRRGYKAVITFP